MPLLDELVKVDAEGVRRDLGEGRFESVAWSRLRRVFILTTSDGPFSEDAFFVLEGERGEGCVVPNAVARSSGLLDRLFALPGFDTKAVIDAMICTDDARFDCWERAIGDA